MKNYTLVIGLFIFLAFMAGMTALGTISNDNQNKQDIACIQAGGKVQTFPKACVNKD